MLCHTFSLISIDPYFQVKAGIHSGKYFADRNGTERILLFCLNFEHLFRSLNKRICSVPLLSVENVGLV